jgi:hypothetical protein
MQCRTHGVWSVQGVPHILGRMNPKVRGRTMLVSTQGALH